jgi:nudix-type nucleoside diphosphatase (YffH/AdpP family)
MTDVFVYGTLCHAPLRAVVLGRDCAVEDAHLPDHAVYWAKDHAFPLIVSQWGGQAAGMLLRGLSAEDVARLDFYEGGFGYQLRVVTVETTTGPVQAQVYIPEAGRWQAGEDWSLADWADRLGPVVVATAGDFMALYGAKPAAVVARRYGHMLVRGAARLRAGDPQPARLRLTGGVQVSARREPYAHFFAVEEYDLSFQRFDGSPSPVVTRAVFVSGDAVTVLPYDPVRDRVLVVEQFRSGPFARGDSQPWQIEAIAGRIDVGETAEEAARREAVEEAGLTLGALLPVAGYYPTPGISAEFLYSYVAITDLPDGSAGVFGVEGEAEDIRGHLISFDDLMALVASGEISNAPLIMTAYWLQARRGDLRGG